MNAHEAARIARLQAAGEEAEMNRDEKKRQERQENSCASGGKGGKEEEKRRELETYRRHLEGQKKSFERLMRMIDDG